MTGLTSKGSALDFDDAAWYKTLAKAFKLDELIHKHSTIMDKYDPREEDRTDLRRVGHLVRCRARHESRIFIPAEYHA